MCPGWRGRPGALPEVGPTRHLLGGAPRRVRSGENLVHLAMELHALAVEIYALAVEIYALAVEIYALAVEIYALAMEIYALAVEIDAEWGRVCVRGGGAVSSQPSISV